LKQKALISNKTRLHIDKKYYFGFVKITLYLVILNGGNLEEFLKGQDKSYLKLSLPTLSKTFSAESAFIQRQLRFQKD